jgi:hypothetical protein
VTSGLSERAKGSRADHLRCLRAASGRPEGCLRSGSVGRQSWVAATIAAFPSPPRRRFGLANVLRRSRGGERRGGRGVRAGDPRDPPSRPSTLGLAGGLQDRRWRVEGSHELRPSSLCRPRERAAYSSSRSQSRRSACRSSTEFEWCPFRSTISTAYELGVEKRGATTSENSARPIFVSFR